jgi:hypothetical protein
MGLKNDGAGVGVGVGGAVGIFLSRFWDKTGFLINKFVKKSGFLS